MDITIQPKKLHGPVEVIPSKSQAHRYLICAAFADKPTTVCCRTTSRDIEATADCLRALGAKIDREPFGYCVEPVREIPETAQLPCCESGSTLRFLLPVVGALGVDGTFLMEGRLPQRPLSPLWEEMERMGCSLSRPSSNTVRCTGKLRSGSYSIPGNVSSQFISGLLFAHMLMEDCTLEITGAIESAPYIDMTRQAIAKFPLKDSPVISVEGDWSNAAFWLAAKELGSELYIHNLRPDSPQGDRACAELIPALQEHPTVCAADIPDLVPILSVVAAAGKGAVFTNIRRLRIKESDRVASTVALLESLGGKAEATSDTLTVYGTGLTGGTVDAVNDHRIAMSAAIAATVCTEPVTILGAECVEKSYPQFWEEYARLGGNYELNLR
ncbi:MAG: 3-phosphoshikimate 1-carboxyvinyltransferase [Oscillospiraceae bacterium]|nr:3-phosphoshikimate 1-carboxyvinyltransferase [Oscillospiraceae bacterium]